MEDIVRRLRDEVGENPVNYRAEMMRDAAREIELLRQQLADMAANTKPKE